MSHGLTEEADQIRTELYQPDEQAPNTEMPQVDAILVILANEWKAPLRYYTTMYRIQMSSLIPFGHMPVGGPHACPILAIASAGAHPDAGHELASALRQSRLLRPGFFSWYIKFLLFLVFNSVTTVLQTLKYMYTIMSSVLQFQSTVYMKYIH